MHNRRLIDRQTGLLRHLTGEAFMFGTNGLDAVGLDPDLQGMDLARLRLEAEFSFNKRTARIRETFTRTASLYGVRFSRLLRDFAIACPPRTYERYLDAQDFFDWFEECRTDDPSVPAWTSDVAKLEIALARARTFRPGEAEQAALAARPTNPSSLWYRAHPCVALARCRFDIGPLFHPGRRDEKIVRRDVPLAVLASRNRRRPEIMEVMPVAFELLEVSPGWSRLAPGSASSGALVMNLAEQGLMLAFGDAPGPDDG